MSSDRIHLHVCREQTVSFCVCVQDFTFKYDASGPIPGAVSRRASYRYAENAPGKTEIKPKTDSSGLSRMFDILYSNCRYKSLVKTGQFFDSKTLTEILSSDQWVQDVGATATEIYANFTAGASDIWIAIES